MKFIRNGLVFYGSEQMSKIPGLVHGFSTRQGGVSQGAFASFNFGLQDDKECVLENYRRACQALGISHLVVGHQQHTDTVQAVTMKDAGRGMTVESRFERGVDALVTNCRGLGLGVLGADCPGVLLCDPQAGAIGAAHSGWRGTVMKIAAKTALKMGQLYGARPERMFAVVGPSIHVCHFETGLEVAQEFCKAYGTFYDRIGSRKGDKAYLNLPEAIRYDLEQIGIPSEQISVLPHCTMCETETFFSHRRGDLGRICGFIFLK